MSSAVLAMRGTTAISHLISQPQLQAAGQAHCLGQPGLETSGVGSQISHGCAGRLPASKQHTLQHIQLLGCSKAPPSGVGTRALRVCVSKARTPSRPTAYSHYRSSECIYFLKTEIWWGCRKGSCCSSGVLSSAAFLEPGRGRETEHFTGAAQIPETFQGFAVH